MPQWKASLSHQWECPEGRKMGWCAWWQLEACLDPETLLALCEHMLVLLLVSVPFLLEAAKKTKPKNINTEVPCYRLGHIRKIWRLVENDSNPNVFSQFELQAWQCQGEQEDSPVWFLSKTQQRRSRTTPPMSDFQFIIIDVTCSFEHSRNLLCVFPMMFAVKGNRNKKNYSWVETC